MYCMAPSPSHSRRGRSPRWISRGMNRRGNPPKRFHPFRHCARQSAIMGHPPGCGLPGAFRRSGASCVTRLRTAIAAVALPSHVPFCSGTGRDCLGRKKRSLILTRIPLFHTLCLFPASFCKKNAIFFFLRPRSPDASFRPLYAYGRKTVSSLWPEELLKEKKRAGLSFS